MTSKPVLPVWVCFVVEKPLARPGVDRASIGALVREFYSRVRKDGTLGQIYAREIAAEWETQQEKMTDN